MSKINFKDDREQLSYALGMIVATNLKSQGFTDLDTATLAKGMEAGLTGDTTTMSLEEADQYIQSQMAKVQEAKHAGAKQAGIDFLHANKSKEGVNSTASGLQYEILRPGNGPKPKATDKVTVHYEGRLIDGTIFDSSYQRNQPATFPLNGVIAGWTEGLQLMTIGSKFRFYIPFGLGYGARGAGESIPPFSTLIFDVELLSIG